MNLCSLKPDFYYVFKDLLQNTDQESILFLKLKYFARNNLLRIKGSKK
jgi:hypothetical protein